MRELNEIEDKIYEYDELIDKTIPDTIKLKKNLLLEEGVANKYA